MKELQPVDLPIPDRRIELTVTASVGLGGRRILLAHNAQRQNAPAHYTHYYTITIEEKFPQAATSPTDLSRHLSAFASRMQIPDQRMELIVTASAGLAVWSGQHMEHNAQRQKPLRALLLTLLPPSKEIFLYSLNIMTTAARVVSEERF